MTRFSSPSLKVNKKQTLSYKLDEGDMNMHLVCWSYIKSLII